MKILCFGDLHDSARGLSYNRPVFLSRALDFLREQIDIHKPDFLVNMGDTIDSPFLKDTTTLRYWQKFLKIVNQHTCYHLLGSHDPVSVDNKLSMISDLRYMENQHLVIRDLVDSKFSGAIGFVSYLGNIDDMCQNNDVSIVFTHHDLGKKYKKYPKVQFINGHLHLPAEADNCYYVGGLLYNVGDYHEVTSLSADWYEADGLKYHVYPGITIIDTETGKLERVFNKEALLQFRIILYNAKDLYGISSILNRYKSNSIRLRIINKSEDVPREEIFKIINQFKRDDFYYAIVDDMRAVEVQAEEKTTGEMYNPEKELERLIRENYQDQVDVYEEVIAFEEKSK